MRCFLFKTKLVMNKEELIEHILKIIGSDERYSNQISDYENYSESRPEDFIESRTSFEQMVSYANEMKYKIKDVRNLVLHEKY